MPARLRERVPAGGLPLAARRLASLGRRRGWRWGRLGGGRRRWVAPAVGRSGWRPCRRRRIVQAGL